MIDTVVLYLRKDCVSHGVRECQRSSHAQELLQVATVRWFPVVVFVTVGDCRCCDCGKKLAGSKYAALNDRFYCINHYEQRFKQQGGYGGFK